MNLEEYEHYFPHVKLEGMTISTPNRHCAWRVDTFYTKEPDTVEWLGRMEKNSLFFDVGANIGLYSLYAAKRGVRTFAFEPESQNYSVLCRNIAINKLPVTAFPVAIGNRESIDTLRVGIFMAGSSCHTFGQDKNYRGEAKEFDFHQGCVSRTLDSFGYRYGFPDYVKIDVDGLENEVLEGMSITLDHLKSVLVEMDSNNPVHMAWFDNLKKMGFQIDEQQIFAARRQEGPFKGIGNVIFTKPDEE